MIPLKTLCMITNYELQTVDYEGQSVKSEVRRVENRPWRTWYLATCASYFACTGRFVLDKSGSMAKLLVWEW